MSAQVPLYVHTQTHTHTHTEKYTHIHKNTYIWTILCIDKAWGIIINISHPYCHFACDNIWWTTLVLYIHQQLQVKTYTLHNQNKQTGD